jgi:hypothetical protein
MGRFKFWFLIGGVALLALGWEEKRLAGLAHSEPSSITLQRLAEDGPGDNAHVEIRDFLLCTWDYVYAEKRGRWTEVWVPAVPLDGEFHQQILAGLDEEGNWPEGVPFPNPDDFEVLFKITDSPTEASVDRIAEADTVRGMIINEVESIGSEERDLLASSYPGADFDTVLLFETPRSPKGAGTVYGMLGGGAGLLLLGLALLGQGFLGRREETTFEPEPIEPDTPVSPDAPDETREG